jgi:ATP-binding cassette subfamily F protein uup
MANLISCKALSKSFGAQKLFTDVSLTVNSGDRIGVIGPNGSGKSTLLKILCGLEDADSGELLSRKFLSVSYLSQQDHFDLGASVEDNLLAAFDDADLEDTEKYNSISSLLSRAEFEDKDLTVGLLSGGWRKRLSICRALLGDPDILVMDEPTNHLDIEGILWLEKMLGGGGSFSAYLLVSHDRRFLENCTNRVIELSSVYPEGTLQVQGAYSRFLEVREDFIAAQQQQESRLANRARREIEWLRRGPKARATKAKSRIDEAYKLTEDLASVKERNRSMSKVQIDFEATGRKTRKLLEARGISKSYGEQPLFEGVDLVLSPGSRIGLLGRNGCGKSTLMNILAGATMETGVRPDSGTLRPADKLQIVRFDQNRESIDPTLTLRRALAPEGDSIIFRGRSLHVVSWAKKFLFRPDQLETPVGQLSGGEQARILIADLMRQPADLLLLDEPTNDLDISSLDVLESSLVDFPGAVVLVSHDRFLLDTVCDRILGFGGSSGVSFYADYQQWLADLQCQPEKAPEKKKPGNREQPEKKQSKGRLSYMEQREYDQIEDLIGTAENQRESLQARMTLPEVMADADQLANCWRQAEELQAEIEKLYDRWGELEVKKEQG